MAAKSVMKVYGESDVGGRTIEYPEHCLKLLGILALIIYGIMYTGTYVVVPFLPNV